ncbi:gamma-glutamylcyclotransferase [Vibrio pelagius]|uniref:gamma-glutamylcyclotransferase family protein n=1 Tax=Vibrio pelagius TaxID=28169 RepID=UPI00354BDAB4
MSHLVFVYGTLRKGQHNHHFLKQSEKLGDWVTPPQFALYDLGSYPGMIFGKKKVLGEVYIVSDYVLALLDRLEDVPTEYRREQIETIFGLAWVYLYQYDLSEQREILTGDWCKRE